MCGEILISMPNQGSTQHKKPLKLIERLLTTSTLPGMNVLDPFSGSGVTAIACKNLNRNFYGCDIDNDYYEKSVERLKYYT